MDYMRILRMNVLPVVVGFSIATLFVLVMDWAMVFTPPQKVDSMWLGGPNDWSTSLDYMGLHPVCRDALRTYVVTDPKMVAYMCNMVGDIWVTELMQENAP